MMKPTFDSNLKNIWYESAHQILIYYKCIMILKPVVFLLRQQKRNWIA